MKFRRNNVFLVLAICIMMCVVIYRQHSYKTNGSWMKYLRFEMKLEKCPWVSNELQGYVEMPDLVTGYIPTLKELEKSIKIPSLGCEPRRNVAIIVPYRNRETQLRIFLQHIHPILQRQKLQYTIFIIEQYGDERFNRAKLLNVGFQEARKAGKFDCFYLHDVDILLENDRCLLCKEKTTRHFATKMNKFAYETQIYSLPICLNNKYAWNQLKYYGGILRVSEADMVKANGLSNEYWSWGAEDDDFYFRLMAKDIPRPVSEDEQLQCTYSMLNHSHEFISPTKDFLLKHCVSRADVDGLNSLKYEVKYYNVGRLYTNITVDIGHPLPTLSNLTNLEIIDKNLTCNDVEAWLRNEVFKQTTLT